MDSKKYLLILPSCGSRTLFFITSECKSCSGHVVVFETHSSLQYHVFLMVHFKVVCFVAKPLNRSEAKVDLFKWRFKLYHKKEMLSIFHFNGHTPVFHRQTSKCEPPCKGYLTVLHENLVD